MTQRIKMSLLLGILLAIVCSMNMVCNFFPEASFKLASDSRLPKWVTLPPELTRANVSLELSYYVKPWGGRARFTLRDKNGQVIKKEGGKTCTEPFQLKSSPQGDASGYPSYEAVTVNGITEIIEQRKPEPIFYVTDDTAVWKQYKSIGCR